MSDLTQVAPDTAAMPAVAPVTDTPDTSPISARDAARALSQRRWEKSKEPKTEEAAPQEPEPPQELAETPSDDPPQEAPVEATESQPDPAETPPIEPPRSWTKDEQEKFKSYPRELQAYLSEREQQRDRAVRQSQNEAAEKLKGLTAKEQQVEQARQQYEAALPQLLQTLQEQQAGAFADLKTQADVDRLSQEDPFRYIQWTAHREKVAAVHREMQSAQERQARDWQDKWADFAQREDAKVVERIPELADPKQKAKVQESALTYLKDTGFSDNDLGSLWNGQTSLSLRDHRVQGMIRDAVKYREGQESAKKAIAAKPLPPVQKPGVAAPRGAADTANIQNLSKKLDQTGSIKDAAALIAARRAARR